MTVAIRVKPGVSRARVGGVHEGPLGAELIVAVQSPPVDGKATEAARRALAAALGLRPSAVSLRSGAASRDKLFAITDPPADLAERLTSLRAAG
ncbi:uncharacterized protein YggU (UPF0235/DUF167 family) [Allocatelliglobosispora scoriae]|uniref:UPF0235 protein F4553_002738 n=1 Tax=Allocatelliglobosispora scoriae TaxID=643052 RepID=A0A841BQA0_9ACTN|nr:DUF167 domain-containing protein [Allocatelliglobosispora scoriae]MBB5869359.1 uncharacterized protein YggU (UPF0235/DUF167 family) [Allocatelliglobosispora scoriae]